MSTIQILDPLLANQIAAGEVVERPASVVKELVENAIDAGSTRIDIEISKGGVERIRIRDNGCGIAKEDLTLACVRHATSKIASYQDLTEVASLGFRGEALASIAAVSKLKLISRTQEQEQAWQVSTTGVEGDIELMPAAHPQGTTIDMRELFYNTPARRRFLRTDKTEYHHVETVILRQALSRFDIGFRLTHNDKVMFDLPLADSETLKEQRIQKVLGKDFVHAAVAIDYQAAGMGLTGWIASAEYNRAQADQQYCYINGRFVRDKMIMSAVKQAYRDVMFHGRHPAYVLYLNCGPGTVDVNVHPTKHEVRFRDGRAEYRFIMQSVKQSLESLRLGQQTEAAVEQAIKVDHETGEVLPSDAAPSFVTESTVSTVAEMVKPKPQQVTMPLAGVAIRSAPKVVPAAMPSVDAKINAAVEHLNQQLHAEPESNIYYPLGVALAQLHDIYILAQNEKGLIVVDMHAAHERVLFETMKQQMSEQSVQTQALLIPVDVKLSAKEMHHLEEQFESLRSCGFEIEVLGDEQVVVRQIPSLLHKADIASLIRDIAADVSVLSESQRAQNTMMSLMANMACKAAIKAHHRLTIEEMNHLLRQMETISHGGLCNHGRPAWKQFDMKEIDRWFLRGQ